MKNSKKIFLGILLLIFLIIIIIVFYLSSKVEKDDNPSNEEVVVENRFEKVNDYKEFFDIQTTLNDINNVSFNTSYTIKEIYVNGNSKVFYYFINAHRFEELNYDQSVYFLLILNNLNRSYELFEITEDIKNLEEYAKNYDIKNTDSISSQKLLSSSISVENILTLYIEHFKKMLIYNNMEAFNMLAEETKAKYLNYEDFNNKTLDIYNKLTSKIFSYSEGEKREDGVTYYLEDDKRNKIVIYEESIMNFKISY